LPGGLTLDPATGVISGTPSGQLGTFAFAVVVDDSSTNSAVTWPTSPPVDFALTANAPAPANSTTALASSTSGTSVFGQPVTFTATVVPVAPATGTPTGTVQFTLDGSNFGGAVALAAGSATSGATTTFSVGNHTVTAIYNGDVNFNGSTSPNLTQTVNKADTTQSFTSTANPSISGQSVSFTATVTPVAPGAGTPTGTVQFTVDAANFGTPVALSGGVATSSPTTTLSTGTHQIGGVYGGDANFLAGTPVPLTQTVNPATSPATQLKFTTQPVVTDAGQPINGAPTVEIDDASGNKVPNATNAVTITIANNPSGGTLSGTTLTVAAQNGVANFTDARIDLAGQGYTLTASATGLASATSNAFDVQPVITSLSPASAAVGGPQFTLTVNGTGFPATGFSVFWNGSSRTSTVVNSTQMTATIPATDLVVPGTINVTVANGPPPGSVSSLPATFTVAAPLSVVTSSLPPGTAGAAYPGAILAVSGGVGPFTWSASQSPGRTLPAGMTLDSAGNLSGTPTTAGAYPVAVSVSDSTGNFAVRTFLLVITTGNPCILNGQYAFLFQGFDSGGAVAIGGSFIVTSTATGGDVTSGEEDINRSSGVSQQVTISIASNACLMVNSNFGVLTLSTAQPATTTTYLFTADTAGTMGRFIEFDRTSASSGTSGSGLLLKQTSLALGSGNAVFGLAGEFTANISPGFGQPGVPTRVRAAALGQVNLDPAGSVTNGEMDVSTIKSGSLLGTAATAGPLTPTGAFTGPVDANGRSTATLTVPSAANNTNLFGTLTFAYYVVNAQTAILVETDIRSPQLQTPNQTLPVLSGLMKPQAAIAGGFGSLGSGSRLIFATQGQPFISGVGAAIGVIVTDGAGNFAGEADNALSLNGSVTHGTYTSVDAMGRTSITFNISNFIPSAQNQVVYLAEETGNGNASGFIMDAPGGSVNFGEIKQVTGRPPVNGFTNGSLTGTFRVNSVLPSMTGTLLDAGQGTMDGIGTNPDSFNFGFNEDTGANNPLSKLNPIQDSYIVTNLDRGVVLHAGSTTPSFVFYVVSPTEFLCLRSLASATMLWEFKQ
jgi:hypothetical protein